MQKSSTSTGSTPPETPDTRPSFGRRLLAFLAYGSGRSQPSSPFLDMADAMNRITMAADASDPTWLKESRASLAMQNGARARSEAPTRDLEREALKKADPWLCGYAYGEVPDQKPPPGPPPADLGIEDFAANFVSRYPDGKTGDAARAQAWRDSVVWRRRLLSRDQDQKWLNELREKENAIYLDNLNGQSSTIQDRDAALEKARAQIDTFDQQMRDLERAHNDMRAGYHKEHQARSAAETRADMLNAAIQYALGGLSSPTEALIWLSEWNEGDEAADDELREWINGPGRELLGEAVAGRIGVPPVPPPVGRERPGPAEVRAANTRGPAPGYVASVEGQKLSGPLPVHPEAVNFSPGAFVLGGVKVGYGVTCLELGGQRQPVAVSIGTFRPRFTQGWKQREVCTNRVTDTRTGRESCNKWPLFGTGGTICKGCPAFTGLAR